MSCVIKESVPDQNPDIYSNYFLSDTYSELNFGRFWINLTEMKTLTKDEPLLELRTKVMQQLSQIPLSLPNKILGKYFSYERKKNCLFCLGSEQTLNKESMDKMALLFAKTYMNSLLHSILKIQETMPRVMHHFHQFKAVVTSPESAKENVATLIEEMREIRATLHRNLEHLSIKTSELEQRIRTCVREGKAIGPAFGKNPIFFLHGSPMLVLNSRSFQAPSLEEAVNKMESIKQQRSVAEGTYHFYRLLMNSTRTLRNMEQGMAKRLATLDSNSLATPSAGDMGTQSPCSQLERRQNRTDEIMLCFKCPITKKWFEDPVIVVETGHSYERSALESSEGLRQLKSLAGKPLSSVTLIPNLTLKVLTQRFQASSTVEKFAQLVPEFLSSISYNPLKNPHVVSSGITYEKEEAEAMVRDRCCLVTHMPLTSGTIVRNETLIKLMDICKPSF